MRRFDFTVTACSALLASALCVSCSSKKEREQNIGATQATPAASTVDVATEVGADRQDAPVATTDSETFAEVPGVAPLTREMVTEERSPEAKALNADGLKAHRAGNFSEAIGHFKKALDADPGALLARYNLACSLVRSGASPQALALLEQFRQVACTGCGERLARARVDKDWETLWNNSKFQKIVALPEEGHQVGSAYLQLRFPKKLKRPAFTLRPRMVLDRLPGDAALAPFELVLRDANKEIARAPMDLGNRKGAQVVGAIEIPGVGRYALDLVSGGRVYESRVFEIRKVLSLGGQIEYEVNRVSLALAADANDAGDDWVTVGEEDFAATIEWSFPLPGDANYSYLQVWKRNGRVDSVDTFEVEGVRLKIEEAQTVIGRLPVSIEIPTDPGKWMLGLYSETGKSFEIRYDLTRGAYVDGIQPRLKILDKAPAWTKKHHDEAGYDGYSSRGEVWSGEGAPNSTRLIRAATRSTKVMEAFTTYEQGRTPEAAESLLALAKKYGGPWKASELPSASVWPKKTASAVYADPPMGTCSRTRCSEYPAISPDGKFVVSYQPEEIKFWDEEDECWRPEGMFIRYWDVASGKEVESKDLSQFKPMHCAAGDIDLEAGFKLTMSDDGADTYVMTLKDKNGKTVEKIEEFSVSLDHCTVPGVRVVVTETGGGSSHCHETATNWYGMTSY